MSEHNVSLAMKAPFKWCDPCRDRPGTVTVIFEGSWSTIEWSYINEHKEQLSFSERVVTEALINGDWPAASFQSLIPPEVFCVACAVYIHKSYTYEAEQAIDHLNNMLHKGKS